MRILDAKYNLSERSFEYFGGDVQGFDMVKIEHMVYGIQQRTHQYGTLIIARTVARNVNEAVKKFNAMARYDERTHA